MRRIKQFMLVVLAAFGLTQGAFADDAANYTGTTPDVVTGNVYIINVGTGKWIAAGNSWGTQASLGDIAERFTFSGSSMTYQLTSTRKSDQGQKLSFMSPKDKGGNSTTKEDYGKFYLDQPGTDITFTAVDGLTNVYTMQITNPTTSDFTNPITNITYTAGATYYLAAPSTGTELEAVSAARDSKAQWKLVTEDEFTKKYEDKAINAINTGAADATQYIYAPDFTRNDDNVGNYWFISETGSTPLSDYKTGNHQPSEAFTPNTYYTYKLSATYTLTLTSNSENYENTTATISNDGTDLLSPLPISGYTTTTDLGSSIPDELRASLVNNMPATSGYNVGDTYNTYFTIFSIDVDYTLSVTTSTSSTYTYYWGNGYAESKIKDFTGYDGENKDANGNIYDAETYYQWLYGGEWTANIHGDGVVRQTINVGNIAEGWYIITCKGFTTEKDKAQLFAYSTTDESAENYSDKHQERPLIDVAADAVPATYVKASKLLKSSEDYKQSVMIWADANSDITFGVKTSNTSEGAWACFDEFQLSFAGGKKNDYVILSENRTDLEYMTKQVDKKDSHVLRLERTLKAGQWNSIMLPVNLTVEQVTTAFGGGVKLSELKGVLPEGNQSVITFQQKTLANNKDIAIEAGKLYIIKPQVAPDAKNAGEFDLADRVTPPTGTSTPTQGKINLGANYVINQVTLDKIPENTKGIISQANVPGSEEIGAAQLAFKGTLINQTDNKTIPVNSYVLSTKYGKWFRSTTKTYAVRGFRAWIEEAGSNSKGVAFEINGVRDDDPTAIEQIFNEPADKAGSRGIYTLGGQKVSEGNSMSNLPKGIYIVNGKKYVVK